MNANGAMVNRLLNAGCDMLMTSIKDKAVNISDYSSPINQQLVRHAVKDICYVQVNSNLMQGISSHSMIEYSLSPWKIALICINVVVGLFTLAGMGYWLWSLLSSSQKRSRRLLQ